MTPGVNDSLSPGHTYSPADRFTVVKYASGAHELDFYHCGAVSILAINHRQS